MIKGVMVTNLKILKALAFFTFSLGIMSMFGFTQADIETANNLDTDSRFILSQLVDCANNPCNEQGYVNQLIIEEDDSPITVSYEYSENGNPSVINLEGSSNFFTQLSIVLRPDLNIDHYERTFLGFIPGGNVITFNYEFAENGAIKSASVNHGSGLDERTYNEQGILIKESFNDTKNDRVSVKAYNANGLVTSENVTSPDGNTSFSYEYYSNGNLRSKESLHPQSSELETQQYDINGNIISSTCCGDFVSEYSYTNGVLTGVTETNSEGVSVFVIENGIKVSGTHTGTIIIDGSEEVVTREITQEELDRDFEENGSINPSLNDKTPN